MSKQKQPVDKSDDQAVSQPASADKPPAAQPTEKPYCGVVMPISEIDGCSESHWQDVRKILYEVIDSAGFKPNLVSESESIGVILKDIVANLYTYPLIIADVSGKNSNVYFELGMRLTFDLPTIVIKDNQTDYSFDTAAIRHLTYPRDLRYWEIEKFKLELKSKIHGTIQESKKEGFSMFLKQFGQFKIPEISTTVVSKDDYIIEELRQLRLELIGRKTRKTDQAVLADRVRERLQPRQMTLMESYMKDLYASAIDWISSRDLMRIDGESSADHLKRITDGFEDHLLSSNYNFDPRDTAFALRAAISGHGSPELQQLYL